jgi:predicted dienelactone hydrolase
VATIDPVVLDDAARGKQLELKVYHPLDGGPYPLVVFSHGMGGSKDVGAPLMEYWASHGYVVICPTHSDSVKLRRSEGKSINKYVMLREFGSRDELRVSRVEDDVLILDSLDVIEQRHPELAGLIDHGRIGISGHSAGAMTTQLLMGAKCELPESGGMAGFHDGRFDCALVLSGQGANRAGFSEQSWEDVAMPVMVMTGSLDYVGGTRQTPQSRCDPYTFSPPGDKYLVFINNALHSSFTGKAAQLAADLADDNRLGLANSIEARFTSEDLDTIQSTDQVAIFDYVKLASLRFWDAHLKGDGDALAWLTSDALADFSGGEVEYSYK